jgi:small conductance mechanosensitive channel
MIVIFGVETSPYLEALVAAAATYVVAKVVSRLLARVFEKTPFPENLERGMVKASKYVVYLVGLLVVVGVLGIDLTSIVIGLGAFSIAVSFALSDLIKNLVSGILIQADRPFKVGDVIQVKSFEGRVVRMRVRTTELETEDGHRVFVPNSMFATNAIVNRGTK